MKDILPAEKPENTFTLPYHLGVLLAANAVSDACVVIDGPDCVMSKIDYLAGNHDLNSTLISPEGAHRVVCSMGLAAPQRDHPERALSAMVSGAAGSGRFGVVLLTALPFLKISGVDYAGVAAASGLPSVPAVEVPAASLEADWLEGYALSLEALARALPDPRGAKRPRSVALVGLLVDRLEGDHAGNVRELRRLLKLCGLDLTCVFPSGGKFGELAGALRAEVIVSLPYGRKAASLLAARSGAKLVETGLPLGLKGTTTWLATVARAAGIAELPAAVTGLERRAALTVSPVVDSLAHRNAVYAGDPHLFAAFSSFARELRINVRAAVINSKPMALDSAFTPSLLLFSPGTAAARAAIAGLNGFSKADLLVGNSFAGTENLCPGLPLTELGFPSYGRHCLADEPFLGYEGAKRLAASLFNSFWRSRA